MENIYDVIIIGSGPAGLTAAIYTTRANLKTLVIAGRTWGGQLMLTTLVENFPGFPEGIQGPDLMRNMRKQAEKHGAEIIDVNYKEADFTPSTSSGQAEEPLEVHTDEDKVYKARTVLVATGADTKWLGVPGEKEKIGRGVSSCAPCDAAFFRNKNVIVVGGGDSAMEEAEVLAKFANNVFVVHRRGELRASQIMQRRAMNNPKIHFIFNTQIQEILGEQKVEKVKVKTVPSDKSLLTKSEEELAQVLPKPLNGTILEKKDDAVVWEMPIDGVFVAIGHIPNSQVFKGIETDEKGFIKVYEHTKTNIDRVYVAGDVHDFHYQQAVTAAGFGCMAALDLEKYLRGSHQSWSNGD